MQARSSRCDVFSNVAMPLLPIGGKLFVKLIIRDRKVVRKRLMGIWWTSYPFDVDKTFDLFYI